MSPELKKISEKIEAKFGHDPDLERMRQIQEVRYTQVEYREPTYKTGKRPGLDYYDTRDYPKKGRKR